MCVLLQKHNLHNKEMKIGFLVVIAQWNCI